MVQAFDKLGQLVFVSYIEDCCENEGGYWCQVYWDEDLDWQVDDFCIHPDDCNCQDEDAVEAYIQDYIRDQQYDPV